jgi:hypothetical protein
VLLVPDVVELPLELPVETMEPEVWLDDVAACPPEPVDEVEFFASDEQARSAAEPAATKEKRSAFFMLGTMRRCGRRSQSAPAGRAGAERDVAKRDQTGRALEAWLDKIARFRILPAPSSGIPPFEDNDPTRLSRHTARTLSSATAAQPNARCLS